LKATPVFIEVEGDSVDPRVGVHAPGIELCFLGCAARSLYYEDRAIFKSAEFRLIELYSLSLANLCQLSTCTYNHVRSRCINERE
jgi:hypothetical protein